MKKEKQETVKCYHVVKVNDKEGTVVKHLPKKLASDTRFLTKMKMYRADEMDGSEENFKKKKEEYITFLKGSNDVVFLKSLAAQEQEVYKVEAINLRIKELEKPNKKQEEK